MRVLDIACFVQRSIARLSALPKVRAVSGLIYGSTITHLQYQWFLLPSSSPVIVSTPNLSCAFLLYYANDRIYTPTLIVGHGMSQL
jgi:hypothetical protein